VVMNQVYTEEAELVAKEPIPAVDARYVTQYSKT
jgi:hypothetical protein